MNNEFGARDELEELTRDVGEHRLVLEKLVVDPVDLECARVDGALGIDVAVKRFLCRAAIDDLYTADLDDPVTRFRFQTRCFGIEHDLPHRCSRV